MTRSRECVDEYGYPSDTECNGTETQLIECVQWTELCDESWQVNVYQVPVWSQWTEWNACSVTCGNGTISRKDVFLFLLQVLVLIFFFARNNK